MKFAKLQEFFRGLRSQKPIQSIPTDGNCGVCGGILPLPYVGGPCVVLSVSAELGYFDGEKVSLLEVTSDTKTQKKPLCMKCAVTAEIAYGTFELGPMLDTLGKQIDALVERQQAA